MKHYRFNGDNFGDRPLNDWLAPRAFPGLGPAAGGERVLMFVGSILGHRHKMPPAWRPLPWTVFGSGWQPGYGPLDLPDDVRPVAVRGRLTWDALTAARPGLRDGGTPAFGDPAFLLPRHLPRDVSRGSGTLTVRKWTYDGPEGEWVTTTRTGGDVAGWVRRLLRAGRVVTDSLHAAIVAHAYGVPWTPMRWELKWADAFGEVGVRERPTGFVVPDPEPVAAVAASLAGVTTAAVAPAARRPTFPGTRPRS